jgi:hypothetical protein
LPYTVEYQGEAQIKAEVENAAFVTLTLAEAAG